MIHIKKQQIKPLIKIEFIHKQPTLIQVHVTYAVKPVTDRTQGSCTPSVHSGREGSNSVEEEVQVYTGYTEIYMRLTVLMPQAESTV